MKRYSIVFDNKCAVCNTGVKALTSIGVMDLDQGIELDQYHSNSLACNVDPDRACDEMAVINNESLEVSYGYDGYVKLLDVRHKKISKLLSKNLVKLFINPFYIFLASNRRVIAPIQPSSTTCSPKLKKPYRIAFLTLAALIAGVITYLKGSLLSRYELFNFLTGWKLITITGFGWLFTAILYQKSNKWDYWGHLAMIALMAIFIQIIGLLGFLFFPNVIWIIGSMIFSDLLMIWMHYRRIKILGANQKQTLIWWLILHLTAIGIMFFHIKVAS